MEGRYGNLNNDETNKENNTQPENEEKPADIDLENQQGEQEPEEKKKEDKELSKEEKLQRALNESDERYLRVVAEYENYRKRTSKEKAEIYPRATADTVARFLPILDNFERSLDFDQSSEEFKKGIEMIDRSFKETLDSLGVELIGEVGEQFNPDIHDAVLHIEDPDLDENVVSMVLQKGYRLGDRIIRHAQVQAANCF